MNPNFSTTLAAMLLLAVFAQGFLSMGFQLVASRLLFPVFGTTIFVWAFIISTFLAAFSIGALVGGLASRLARHRINIAIAVSGFVCIGALVCVSNFGHAIIFGLDSLTSNMMVSLGGACLALFLVPAAALSSVLPIAIEALIVRGVQGGLSSGLIYAVSAVGNIVGVLATAFVLIPFFSTSRILILWSLAAAVCFLAFYIVVSLVPFRKIPPL